MSVFRKRKPSVCRCADFLCTTDAPPSAFPFSKPQFQRAPKKQGGIFTSRRDFRTRVPSRLRRPPDPGRGALLCASDSRVNVVFEGSSQCLKEPKRSGAKMVNHRVEIVRPEGLRHPLARRLEDREKASSAQGAKLSPYPRVCAAAIMPRSCFSSEGPCICR